MLRERLEFHLDRPFTSSDLYRLYNDCKRAQRALAATRVYLDTNHWIGLRQVHCGTRSNESYGRLLDVLRRLIKTRRVVVAVSDQLITELCHQADARTRKTTAAIIDELSDGVTLVGFERRVALEMLEWVNGSLYNTDPLPLSRVWTTLPNALGSPEYLNGASAADPAVVKTFEDVFEALRLTDLLPSLDGLVFDAADSQAFADRLTANKERDQLGSLRFEDLFQEEADHFLGMFVSTMPIEVTSELEKLVAIHNPGADDLVSGVKRVFWAQNRTGSNAQALPALRVIAGCAARISTEPSRKFKAGDQGDIFHASAALPYCDVFLTDRPTRHLVRSRPTDLASRYRCSVLNDPAKATDHLQRSVT